MYVYRHYGIAICVGVTFTYILMLGCHNGCYFSFRLLSTHSCRWLFTCSYIIVVDECVYRPNGIVIYAAVLVYGRYCSCVCVKEVINRYTLRWITIHNTRITVLLLLMSAVTGLKGFVIYAAVSVYGIYSSCVCVKEVINRCTLRWITIHNTRITTRMWRLWLNG